LKELKLIKREAPLAVAAVLLVGCAPGGGGAAPAGGGAAAEQIVINVSHINAPSHPVNLGLLRFAEDLEERSGGTMVAHIFDSAVIGGDISSLQQVIANQLEAALIMGVSLWDGYDSRASLELLPFLFSDYQEAIAAFDGELGRWSAENIIHPHGGVVVNYWINGLRQMTNSARPIHTPEDTVGLMWRTPQIEMSLSMFEAFGSAAIAMAFAEVYTSLQMGTVDGQESPLASIYASRFYEVQPYLSLSNHMFATGVFLFSDELWNSLTPEQQQMIHESAYIGARHAQQTTFEYEEQWIQHIRDNGVSVNEVDTQAFSDSVEPLWQTWLDELGNDFVAIAAQYISDPNALAHRFAN
jgi:tripartite ATP-independent transporter DctP family solute receptor